MFTTREKASFSLSKALTLAASDQLRGCLESEMLGEAAARAGTAPSTSGMTLPFELLAAGMQRDMTAAGVSGSEKLVSTAEVSAAGDMLRPWSVVARAGVTIMPGLVGNTVLPVTTATTTAAWLATESTQVTPSQPTIGAGATLKPRSLVALVRYSRFIKIASPGIDAMLARDLTRALATALDAAVLSGGGGIEPVGIDITSGIVTASGIGLSWAALLALLEDLADANITEQNLSFVAAPAVRTLLANRARLSGGSIPIWHDGYIDGRGAYVTTIAPVATLFAGDFSNATVGIWGSSLQIDADPATFFTSGITQFRASLACDVGVTSPAAFGLVSSIT